MSIQKVLQVFSGRTLSSNEPNAMMNHTAHKNSLKQVKPGANEVKLAHSIVNHINTPNVSNIIRKEGKHMILDNDADLRPSVNTLVCDGKGGFRVNYATGEYADKNDEIRECVTQHEEKHIEQVKRTAPDICKGGQEMDGRLVRLSFDAVSEGKHIDYEREAWNTGISCLKDKVQLENNKDKINLDLLGDLRKKEILWEYKYIELFGEKYDNEK